MVKEYFEKLSNLIKESDLEAEIDFPTEVKNFFTGAALYVDGEIRVTLSPVGLAFKLPEKEVEKLIKSGYAKPLKYFPKGVIKIGYALFESPDLTNIEQWKRYFLESIQSKTPLKSKKTKNRR
jgi:TfoX/Sxy family transcriptional regulator of competence genes